MSAEVRPAPASSGQLARTPLPHLLVYAHERQLTGTFDFRAPDGATASVLVRAGQPAKAQLSTPPIYLGQVLLEMGVIDAKMLDESLRAMSTTGQRKLHGLVLLEKNALDTSQLDQGLRVQLLRKVAQLARMPPAAVFEFYTDWDGLTTFGAEPTPIDALSVVWAAIREAPPLDHVKAALERLMQGPRLRITKQAQLDRFGFTSEERRWIDLLRMKPLRLDAFFSSAEINERIARLIVYCLAITKQVELVGEDAEPSSGNIAAAEPSSSAPQSPRSTVGRVTLRRERVRTQPVIEEKSSPDILDRRMSPSPDAAANPEVRRAEINMRAQGVDKQNYFEMLGISPEATTEDVKNAYIALAKTWHPDRLPSALADVKDACARVFARMSEAHQTLTDDEKRRRYLRLMKEGGETPEQQQEIANVLGATVEFQKAESVYERTISPKPSSWRGTPSSSIRTRPTTWRSSPGSRPSNHRPRRQRRPKPASTT